MLGPRAQWKKFPPEVREAKEKVLREREEQRLVDAIDTAATAIMEFLATCAEEGLELKLQTLKIRWRSGETDLAVIPRALTQSLADLRGKHRHKLLAAQIGCSAKLSDYPDTYPARRKRRRLIAVLGGSNLRSDNFLQTAQSAKSEFCELECHEAAVGDLAQSAISRHCRH